MFSPFRSFFLALAIALHLVAPQALAQQGQVIMAVEVIGAQRVEEGTIRSYLLLTEGDVYDPGLADQALKKLFDTQLFVDVQMEMRGDLLVVTVVESPVINQIAFEGNIRVKDEDLESVITLKPRAVFSRTKAQADVQKILTLYRRKGRFSASIEPKVITLEQNRIDLVFEINEGEATEIERIRFLGNEAFTDYELQERIQTKETRWWRSFTSDDSFDPDRVAFDRELLRRFYLSQGFADFKVTSAIAEMTPDRADFFLTFTIEEGARYQLGEIGTEISLKNLSEEQVADEIDMAPGDWYNADLVEKTTEILVHHVSDMGIPFVDVQPRVTRDEEKKQIDIVFEIGEGPRVFVERINIHGNVRTKDKVIRREFTLVEGDPYNIAKMRRSRRQLHGLGYFQRVEIEQQQGSTPDSTTIDVTVEEQSTGSLTFGAGYSTNSGAVVEAGVAENNLLGGGQTLSFKTSLGAKRTKFILSYTEPYLLDREVSGGIDLIRNEEDLQSKQSHDRKETGIGLRAGYRITRDLSQSWGYTIRETEILKVKANASRFITSQAGSRLLSQISHSLSYDRRDSAIHARDGYYLSMRNDLAGFGGEEKFLRTSLDAIQYISLSEDLILQLSGHIGYIAGLGGEDVGVAHRFYLGGNNLRGFEAVGAGPRDIKTKDPLGGELIYTAGAQLDFPIGLPDEYAIMGNVFLDAGSLSQVPNALPTDKVNASIRASVGFGLSWSSPAGPIGVSWGFPIRKESYDKTETLKINFGARF